MKRNIRILLVLGLLLPTSEAAAQYSMAVLGVDTGAGPANRAECLANGLKRQVKRAPGFDLVPGKNLDEIKMVFGCFSGEPACMATAGKSLQVEKLLWGRLEKAGRRYKLTVMLLDVKSSKIEKSVSEVISRADLRGSCSAEVVSRLAMSLLSTRRASLAIKVNVEGARISVGPRFIGLSEAGLPIKHDLLPGTHQVKITAKGYQDWTGTVTIKAGEDKVVDVELSPLVRDIPPQPGPVDMVVMPPPTDEEAGTPNLGWKIAFWGSAAATVGLAVGLGVSGAEVLSLQDDKKKLVMDYRDRIGQREALPPSNGDICSEPRKAPGGDQLTDDEVSALSDVCDSGKDSALVTNVLVGATVAVAALTGFLYYKAYVAEPTGEEGGDTRVVDRGQDVRWAVSPAAGPGGASLGFSLEF